MKRQKREFNFPLATILAMFLITGLIVIAVANDINGAVLSSGIAVIAGLAGYQVGKGRKPKE